jgi:hypothetical protein
MRPVETITGIGEGEIKDTDGGGEFRIRGDSLFKFCIGNREKQKIKVRKFYQRKLVGEYRKYTKGGMLSLM